MDADLKALAAVSEALSVAEDHLAAGESTAAGERVDVAAEGLAALRARWPALNAAQRRLIGATAAPLRARLDAARAALPPRSALTLAPALADPEQEIDPDAVGAPTAAPTSSADDR
jgi:hypothetical protein